MNITCSHCGCNQPISLVEVKVNYDQIKIAKNLRTELNERVPYVPPKPDKRKWWHIFYTNSGRDYIIKYNSDFAHHKSVLKSFEDGLYDAEKNSKYWICKLCKSKNGIGTHI